MRLVVIIALATAVFYLPAAAQMRKIPGLDCKPKTIALYDAGPNYTKADEFVPQHLDFLRAQLQQGTIAVGGPFRDEGKPGGLLVLNLGDRKEVQTLLQQDPFVANNVVTYSLRQWAHCHAESTPPPTK